MLACFLAVHYTGPGHPRSSGAVIVSFGRRRSHCSERRPTFLHRVSNRGPRTCKAVGIPALSSSSSPLLPLTLGGQQGGAECGLHDVVAPLPLVPFGPIIFRRHQPLTRYSARLATKPTNCCACLLQPPLQISDHRLRCRSAEFSEFSAGGQLLQPPRVGGQIVLNCVRDLEPVLPFQGQQECTNGRPLIRRGAQYSAHTLMLPCVSRAVSSFSKPFSGNVVWAATMPLSVGI